MKHTIQVNVTYHIEVEFNPKHDMEETLREFNEAFFECESEEELAKFTATQIARNGGAAGFVEGIGLCEEAHWAGDDTRAASFTVAYSEWEAEVLE